MIKVENVVDVLSEEDSIGMKTDDVNISSAFSIRKIEPEVSLVFRRILRLLVFVCVKYLIEYY
jgi:hypothetical protein